MNYAYFIGELSSTQKQGVVTCIPKGHKDKTIFEKKWTPISLLNVAYNFNSLSVKEYFNTSHK